MSLRLPLRLLALLALLAAVLATDRRPVRATEAAGPEDGPPAAAMAEPARPREREEEYGRTPPELVPYSRSGAPYRRFFTTAPVFRGPGRNKPEPDDVATVKIGLLAPLEGTRDDPAGQALKHGVELALADANAAGGYHGTPFELVAKNDRVPWGSSSNLLAELAYVDRVWSVIGSIDSNSTHVALRAAFKAEVPIVNVGSSDPTITETGIPWIIRCTPDDRQTSYRLARFLFEERKLSRVAVLRSSDRYGRLGVGEFRDAARRLHRPLPMEIQFLPGQEDFTFQLERIAAARVQAVLLWGRAAETALIVKQMRERRMPQLIAGTDRMASREFLHRAGRDADGVLVTMWMAPARGDDRWLDFRRRFRARFRNEPDVFAGYGYDAAAMVVDAVRRAGLNRARIRDALTAIRSYEGVSGDLRFDATSNNIAQPILARIENGHLVVQ